jgi:guanylate kinase
MTAIPKDRLILAIIGPSGAGKSTIITALEQKSIIEVIPTWTTRPRRASERDHTVEHRFVDDRAFDELIAQGFFLDTVALFGLDFRYGLPALTLHHPDRIPTIMLRAPLLSRLPLHYPNFRVYQIEDAPTRTRERLLARSQDGEALGTRLDDYDKEVQLGRQLADRVFVNTELDEVIIAIEQAILGDFAT